MAFSQVSFSHFLHLSNLLKLSYEVFRRVVTLLKVCFVFLNLPSRINAINLVISQTVFEGVVATEKVKIKLRTVRNLNVKLYE